MTIEVGTWGGLCAMADEKFCMYEGLYCITDHEFCMLTYEPIISSYNYTAIMGFGMPAEGSYDALMYSIIG